jgi:uncharacterized protein YjbI with pentapeptide repeats
VRIVDLSYADFYRADLSGASLKGAVCRATVFYQSRLNGTVLRGADLRGANFFEADLHGALFDDAVLGEANFSQARHTPPDEGECRLPPQNGISGIPSVILYEFTPLFA